MGSIESSGGGSHDPMVSLSVVFKEILRSEAEMEGPYFQNVSHLQRVRGVAAEVRPLITNQLRADEAVRAVPALPLFRYVESRNK